MRDKKIRDIAVAALFAAMVTVVTSVVKVPIPATGGYLNFGDIIIFLTSLLLGGKFGFIAGGLGAALADLFGFPSFAIFTFFIKGFEGFVVGYIAHNNINGTPSTLRMTISSLTGGLCMVAGYFIIETIVLGVGPASAELLWNCLQVGMGIAVAIPLATALFKTKMFENFK